MAKDKESKPFYKKWWFIALVVITIFGALGSSDDDEEVAKTEAETEEVVEEPEEPEEEIEEETEVEAEEEVEEPEAEEEGLTADDVSNLENDLTAELETSEYDLSIHSFDYEDGLVEVWVDMQEDPLPTQDEAEDILAGVTWHLAELTEVETSDTYDVNTLLVSNVDDGMIHWLTERYRTIDGEYEMTEEEAFSILPN